jgi:dUTPase
MDPVHVSITRLRKGVEPAASPGVTVLNAPGTIDSDDRGEGGFGHTGH